MIIIGCDFHPSWQQISWLDKETGETEEKKLVHASGEAEKFYKQIPAPARTRPRYRLRGFGEGAGAATGQPDLRVTRCPSRLSSTFPRCSRAAVCTSMPECS